MFTTRRSRLLGLAAAALIASASAVTTAAAATPPPGYCEVTVCNKLERFSLSPGNWVKDKFGESCTKSLLGKEDAVAGNKLSSESRWYQGSFNPTKKSVTRVKTVHACGEEPPGPPR